MSALEQHDPCSQCGMTLREQMKGCNNIECYRQFLTKPNKMSAHTPTPWTDDKFTPIPAGDDTLGLGIFRAKPKVAVRVLSEENYQHAAKCVNEHDGLIEQLESLRAERDGLVEALRSTLPILNDVVHPRIDWVRGTVRTTLAKYEK